MKLKKWIALLLGAVMAVGMTGCVGNLYTKVATIDGMEISSGMYLMLQHAVYAEARGLVEDQSKSVFKQKIDGQSAADWIKKKTEVACLEYVAVQRLSREARLIQTEEAQEFVNTATSSWSSIAQYYADNGIAYDSYLRYLNNEQTRAQLLQHLYAEGGALAVPDEELRAEYEEEYARIETYSIFFTTSDGDDRKDQVQQVVDEAVAAGNSGDLAFEKMVEEYGAKAYALTDREFDLEKVMQSVRDRYVAYDGSDELTGVTEEVLAEMKALPVGGYGYYDVGTSAVVYKKVETFTDDEAFMLMRESIVKDIKTDEFEAYLESVYSTYEVDWVFGARGYLSPKKITSA